MKFLLLALGIATALFAPLAFNALTNILLSIVLRDGVDPEDPLALTQKKVLRNHVVCAISGTILGFFMLPNAPIPAWIEKIPLFFLLSAIPTLALGVFVSAVYRVKVAGVTRDFPGAPSLTGVFVFFFLLPIFYVHLIPTFDGDIFEMLHRLETTIQSYRPDKGK